MMKKSTLLFGLLLGLVSGWLIFAPSVHADPNVLCQYVNSAVGSSKVVECTDSLITDALKRNNADPAKQFKSADTKSCWIVTEAFTSPSGISVNGADCSKQPFGTGEANRVPCADGQLIIAQPGQSSEDACRDHSGYLSLSAECYTGAVVEGKKQYIKASCTLAFKQDTGLANISDGKCYMSDNSDPVFKGEINCDEAKKKVQDTSTTGSQSNPGAVTSGNLAPCPKNQSVFFGLPTWFEYLPPGDNCAIKIDFEQQPNQIWLIGLAIADILLRVAGFIAVLFVIKGGYQYITSQFDPEGTKKAKDNILNALIGLVIAVLSSGIVNFIGHTIKP